MPIRLLTLLVAALVLVSCSPDEPAGLDGFDTSTIRIDDRELFVAVAKTPDQRSQGLMDVTDLGGLDGMLFVFPSESNGGFWMKNTLIPLDIAFFDSDGVLVDGLTMEPCTADPCPSYRPGGSYRYAVEAPEGDLAFVVPGSRLEFANEAPPAAADPGGYGSRSGTLAAVHRRPHSGSVKNAAQRLPDPVPMGTIRTANVQRS